MALALGIGNERLASYEAGRAALPYSVFRELAINFNINPYWLYTGTGETLPTGFDYNDSGIANQIPPRAKFTEVYETFLKEAYERALSIGKGRQKDFDANLQKILDMPKEDFAKVPQQTWDAFKAFLKKMIADHLLHKAEIERIKTLEKQSSRVKK